MKKFLKTTPALLLLACAPCALARTTQTTQTTPQKSGEAVRERRVAAADSRGEADKAAGEPSDKPDKSADKSDEKSAAKAEAPPAESDEAKAEVEALRARAESAASPAERGRLRLNLAERLSELGRGAEAAQLLRSMLAEERFDPQLFYNAGNALARLEQSADAAEAYRKAIAQRRGNYSRAQHNLGVVLTRVGRWEEAEEALRAALRLESNQYAEASYSLGRLHALRGDAALASAEWERTLRLKPEHADAAVALARSLAEGGESERALALLDAFGQRAQRRGAAVPREVEVARGEIVAEANVVAARRAAGSKAHAVEASSARVGDAPAGTAALPDATELLRGARASKGSASSVPLVNGRAHTLLLGARAARADGRNEEAVGLYRRAIREGGGYLAPANMELGFTLASMRRHEEAVAALLSVVRREGARHALVFYHLGRLYEHLGRLGEAGEAFARAAELAGEESPQFYVDLSRVREREGRGREALSAAEAYVRVTARAAAGTPGWARERVESLRKQAEKSGPDAQPAAVKN
ncbi:MAG TPA: tetratricopeptide repeat protein [Pyrinomonadaceae bacterium]|jgi:tetratricopeptide (TPR) repeat protein